MIKILLMLSIFSIGLVAQLNNCSKNEIPTNSDTAIIEGDIDNKTAAEKILTISQLNKEKPNTGIFETKGFIAKIYTCPPCPADAQCKPCMGDNIVISEKDKAIDSYDLTEKEMIIFTVKAKSFIKGKEYNFKIKLTDGKKTSTNLNDAKLINAELIRD